MRAQKPIRLHDITAVQQQREKPGWFVHVDVLSLIVPTQGQTLREFD